MPCDQLIDECRAAFEQWLDRDASPTLTARSKYYTAQEQVLGWLAWQAAWNQQQETIDAMRSAWDAECPT